MRLGAIRAYADTALLNALCISCPEAAVYPENLVVMDP
jgi:hypothetical protein